MMSYREMRWPGTGEWQVGCHIVYYTGNDHKIHLQRPEFILNKQLKPTVIGYLPQANRVMLIKLTGKPLNVNIIHVYDPTSYKSEDEIKDFCAQKSNE